MLQPLFQHTLRDSYFKQKIQYLMTASVFVYRQKNNAYSYWKTLLCFVLICWSWQQMKTFRPGTTAYKATVEMLWGRWQSGGRWLSKSQKHKSVGFKIPQTHTLMMVVSVWVCAFVPALCCLVVQPWRLCRVCVEKPCVERWAVSLAQQLVSRRLHSHLPASVTVTASDCTATLNSFPLLACALCYVWLHLFVCLLTS